LLELVSEIRELEASMIASARMWNTQYHFCRKNGGEAEQALLATVGEGQRHRDVVMAMLGERLNRE